LKTAAAFTFIYIYITALFEAPIDPRKKNCFIN